MTVDGILGSGDVAARRQQVTLHGRAVSYLDHVPADGAHAGPVLVMLHGVGSGADGWNAPAEQLAERGFRAISIDLPGHGFSERAPGDYSLGAMASTVRDLLDHLGLAQVVLLGHSLGGGVSLQFQYQYPSYVAGLVLVSSGGLGRDANMFLRLASLPGAGLVMKAGLNRRTVAAVGSFRGAVRRVARQPEFLSDRVMGRIHRLSDEDGRHSFLATLRSVVDFSGQRVSALDKLHLTNAVPVLIVWGRRDSIIPLAHGERAHEFLESSELVVFEDTGHEPHRKEPQRFARAVSDWLVAHDLAGSAFNGAPTASA